MFVLWLALLLNARTCPRENAGWFKCTTDLDCLATAVPCHGIKSVRRPYITDLIANVRCRFPQCPTPRPEAPPESLCHRQTCRLARDLVSEGVRRKDLKLFEVGCAKNVDLWLDDTHETPLMLAAANANVAFARYALEHGARVDAQTTTGHTALLLATRAEAPRAEILATIDLLLKAGADRHARTSRGENALDLATDEEVRARLK